MKNVKLLFLLFLFNKLFSQNWEDNLKYPLTYTTGNAAIGSLLSNKLSNNSQLLTMSDFRLYSGYFINNSSLEEKRSIYAYTTIGNGSTYGIDSYIPYLPLIGRNMNIYGIRSLMNGNNDDNKSNGTRYGIYSECRGKQILQDFLVGIWELIKVI